MPNYEYIAKTAAGAEVTGAMQAESTAAVARALDDRALLPVRVTPQASAGAAGGRRVRLRDVAVFYGQLSDLLGAGVPLLRALETLERAIPNHRLAQLVRAVGKDIAAGRTLAEAVGDHPEAFTPLHAAMIHAGERAGFLEDVLADLGGFLDRQDEVRNKVRGALIYPAVLSVIGTGVVLVMLTAFVPKFVKFFKGVPLPLPTRVLFAASDILVSQWPALLALAAAAVAALVAAGRSEAGRRLWSRVQLSVPVMGPLYRVLGISRFCRILGTMLRNGVPMLQALDISKDASGNAVLAESIASAAESVKAGESLAEPLKAGGLFPAEIVEMIAVAEESNQLEKVLVKIADTVDRRTTRQLDQAIRLIEPLILVIIAAAVGFIAVGLMYPTFTMGDQLR